MSATADDDEDMSIQIGKLIKVIELISKPKSVQCPNMLTELLRLSNSMGTPDVAEVYSPPKVTDLASRFGLIPGFALDLSVCDPDDGEPWDFDNDAKREKSPTQSQD